MPTRTAARTPAAPVSKIDRAGLPPLIAAAAAFAAAELAIGLTIGGFFPLGRAEALIFLALRPWLLALTACVVAGLPLRSRAILYGTGLVLAVLGETILIAGLGAENPLPEARRGLVAGAIVAAIADAVVQLSKRLLRRVGAVVGLAALLALLIFGPVLLLYESIAIGREAHRPPSNRPGLMMMTALPIIWGERGALDPASRASESYRLLEREFTVRPLDWLSDENLTGRLLLLAQPRALAPEELVALDGWIRRGGRALILADPSLSWPSELPLGDVRRPPPKSLLAPLFDHWNLRLESSATTDQIISGGLTRLVTRTPGHFTAPACRLRARGLVADCHIGKGRALLVADADLLDDRLWAPIGAESHQRTADNPLLVTAWLDELAGIRRERLDPPVAWQRSDRPRATAVLLGFLPALVAALTAAGLAWRPRR